MNSSPQGGAIEILVRPVTSRMSVDKPSVPITDAPASPQDIHLKDAPAVARKAGRALEICVRDRGLGLPTEHLGRIFERFSRIHTVPTREVSGLGLGLTLCKHLIELHGGEIWAESRSPGGSSFHVRLPVDEQQEAPP